MKKNMWVIVLVIVMTATSLVAAEEMKGGTMDKGMKANKMSEGMMGKGMMDEKGGMMMGGKGMMGMHEMMMKMSDTMRKTVVATSDGGVIIVGLDKITKYDKDLNVVKEVELKADTEGMQKMMGAMMEKCPMMGKGMMSGDTMGQGTDKATSTSSEKSSDADADHASHHKQKE